MGMADWADLCDRGWGWSVCVRSEAARTGADRRSIASAEGADGRISR